MRNIFYINFFITLLVLNFALSADAQTYLQREDAWVKSVLQNMSLDHKVGQLFMVRSNSKGNLTEDKIISEYIDKYYIGGIVFFQGSPVEQINLINKYQRTSRIPLFVGLDGEWGLGMRFPKETISYPKQLALGAIQNNELIYNMGREIAQQCKKIGVNINFAPSVDINSNPSNPVIFDRSFGESPENVAEKSYMYMKGLEDEGVMACIKHFPGHGDTDLDSHYDLPILTQSREKLEAFEMFPFKRLTALGASSLMVGHLNIPAIDSRANRPATLSSKVIQNIIREEMSFDGLIFTDAMDMKGVTKYFPNGIAEAEAFLAGNDVILLPENLPKAILTIKKYIADGKISLGRLDASIERILRAKFKLGLSSPPQIEANLLYKYLNRPAALAMKQQLSEATITLVTDRGTQVPYKNDIQQPFATLAYNQSQISTFQLKVSDFAEARHFQAMPNTFDSQKTQLLQNLSQYDDVIISVHTSGRFSAFDREFPSTLVEFIKALQAKTNVVVCVFGSPYILKKAVGFNSVILGYDNEDITQEAAAQAMFGAIPISGKLPVTADIAYPEGAGLNRIARPILSYGIPEMVGMSSDTLMMIDSIMEQMIKLNASPGAQVLIAKDGKIIFKKNYGRLSPSGYYVSNHSIYDVASLTKILATTISTMKLVDERKISIENPIKYYLSSVDMTDKADLTIKDIMAHNARLFPWIPFYENTVLSRRTTGLNPRYYSTTLNVDYNVPVAKNMFMRADYRDTVWQNIITSKLRESDSYRYSDLGFYIMQKIVETTSGKKLNVYADNSFYKPLGLRHTSFNPIEKFPINDIAPTEIDNYFRYQTIHGYVHDMGAAMMGGVSGHAGLFSNSRDIAVIMQMLLNGGIYGNQQYIKKETIDLFTHRHPRSTRRGIGFDMKELDSGKPKSMSDLAPASTFGHTGFTGTAAFADPENNIIFIFCANRTFPSSTNTTFINRDYRSKVQSKIYKALIGYKTSNLP